MSARKGERVDLGSVMAAAEDVEIPKDALISRHPDTAETSLAVNKPKPDVGIVLNGNVEKLAAKFQGEETKKAFSARLPVSLVKLIHQRVHELKAQGYAITKEALAQDAFLKYFGLKEPPQG